MNGTRGRKHEGTINVTVSRLGRFTSFSAWEVGLGAFPGGFFELGYESYSSPFLIHDWRPKKLCIHTGIMDYLFYLFLLFGIFLKPGLSRGNPGI